MVKLGDAFIELSAVEAITPIRDGGGYAVFLTGGRIMNLSDVTENEVAQVLSESGYLEIADSGPALVACWPSVAEWLELRHAFDFGYRYVAKDQSGSVFAYTRPPMKGQSSWLNDDDASKVLRLKNEFASLAFSDPAPMDIAWLFEED